MIECELTTRIEGIWGSAVEQQLYFTLSGI
nr:MAG TPA: hypothetical protein [Caudoviricetes sp.]